MTMQEDGQLKCDKCGILDNNTTNTMSKGWTKEINKSADKFTQRYLHYCPICSKQK